MQLPLPSSVIHVMARLWGCVGTCPWVFAGGCCSSSDGVMARPDELSDWAMATVAMRQSIVTTAPILLLTVRIMSVLLPGLIPMARIAAGRYMHSKTYAIVAQD